MDGRDVFSMINEAITGVFIVVAFYLLSSGVKHLCNINHNQKKKVVEEQG